VQPVVQPEPPEPDYYDADPEPYDADPYDEPEPYRERYREPRPRREPRRDSYDFDDDYDDFDDDYAERAPRRERRERADRYTSSRPRFRGPGLPSADTLGRVFQIATGLIALVFVLHIVFVVTGANQDNDFVSFVYGTSKFFVFGLGDVFTPNDATIGVVLNYSLAALVYVALGRIVARGLRR
jgi:hypothetical protein